MEVVDRLYFALLLHYAQEELRIRRRNIWIGRMLCFSHFILFLRALIHSSAESQNVDYYAIASGIKDLIFSPYKCKPHQTQPSDLE